MNLICPNCKNPLSIAKHQSYITNCLQSIEDCIYNIVYRRNYDLGFYFEDCYIYYYFENNKLIYSKSKFIDLNLDEIFNMPIKEIEQDIQYFFDTAFFIYKKYEQNLIFL